jgi:anti-anti-sigma factor
LYLDGPLRAPVDTHLRHFVHSLFRRGEGTIVLDLTQVSDIDAAGVSELVRTYNMAAHARGAVQIIHPSRWVRQTLQQAGLFDILTGLPDAVRPEPFDSFLARPSKRCLDNGLLPGDAIVRTTPPRARAG